MNSVSVLVFGAHPDDCELKAGGTAILWSSTGCRVCFVSMTNGDAGHHEIGGGPLAKRRVAEAKAAAAVGGVESMVLDTHDGALMPTLENRSQVIRIIREFQPDLVLVNRPNDYHPDHRHASQLIQDAAYSVIVPNIAALSPHLHKDPVMMYYSDTFQKPYPFISDVAVDITEVVEQKIDMIHEHTSQFYEWLPFAGGFLEEVPTSKNDRRPWLGERLKHRFAQVADQCREQLVATYGDRGKIVKYAETFEVCEYGTPLTNETRRRLFPFLP